MLSSRNSSEWAFNSIQKPLSLVSSIPLLFSTIAKIQTFAPLHTSNLVTPQFTEDVYFTETIYNIKCELSLATKLTITYIYSGFFPHPPEIEHFYTKQIPYICASYPILSLIFQEPQPLSRFLPASSLISSLFKSLL